MSKCVQCKQSLVGLPIDTNPWVMCVHFLSDLVPLALHFSDNEAAEQLIGLHGLGFCKFLGVLQFLL
jgi:hypothetical protein